MTPASRVRRAPNRSASRPPASSSAANARVYAVTIHCPDAADSPTERWADGRATDMTVVSRIAINWAAQMTASGHQPCAGAACSASAAGIVLVIAAPSRIYKMRSAS
jgi:hypothetical protein